MLSEGRSPRVVPGAATNADGRLATAFILSCRTSLIHTSGWLWRSLRRHGPGPGRKTVASKTPPQPPRPEGVRVNPSARLAALRPTRQARSGFVGPVVGDRQEPCQG